MSRTSKLGAIAAGVVVIAVVAVVAVGTVWRDHPELYADYFPETARAMTNAQAVRRGEAERRFVAQQAASNAAALQRECRTPTGTWVRLEREIRDSLIAPTTAVFPSYYDRGVEIRSRENDNQTCTVFISAYVDSQNRYGAMIRQYYAAAYEVSVQWDGTMTYTRTVAPTFSDRPL